MDIVITESPTDQQRREAHALFAGGIPDIHEHAIPTERAYSEYLPVLAIAYRDGVAVGAALAVRPKASALAHTFALLGRGRYNDKWDGVRELDLLAVDQSAQGDGIGTALLNAVESHLASAGVKYLIGSALPRDPQGRLRRFYETHGYTIRTTAERHPPLLGMEWNAPAPLDVAFFFDRRISM